MRKAHSESIVKILREEYGKSANIIGAEVGCASGETSAKILRNFSDAFVYMIDAYLPYDDSQMGTGVGADLMPVRIAEALIRTNPWADRRLLLCCRSFMASSVITKPLHFAFIDACHTYEEVWQDIRLWWPRVMPGGVLIGHDYNGRGDRSGKFGVKKAVDEWAEEHNHEVKLRTGLIWYVKKHQWEHEQTETSKGRQEISRVGS